MRRAEQNIDELVASLTSAQAEAVMAEDQHLAVHAGAGAGKTRVLTLRVARMVDDGIDPMRILAITFSRKAAQVLRRRLWDLGVEGIRTGTFHRTALDLVCARRAERGLASPVLISDRRRILDEFLDEPGPRRARASSAFLDTEITWAKSQGLDPEDYVAAADAARRRSSPSPYLVQELWTRYEQRKGQRAAMDFDDLILEAVSALEDPGFSAAIHWRSRHLLVDEFQDVNPMQFAMIQRLMAADSTFFCVGDPNQSIYGFNGADPGLLRSLDRWLPGTRVITLDTNHRSSPEIVSSAASILSHQHRREIHATQNRGSIPELEGLETDTDEAEFVAGRLRSLHTPGRRWRSFAVLARTNAQLSAIARACEVAGIPTQLLAPDLSRASDVQAPADNERTAPSGQDDDAVALGTFHRAKGLEWHTVFVIGASEGLIPYRSATTPAALEEERRLLYVAMTRAEQELVVTWAAKRSDEAPGAASRRRSTFLEPFVAALEAMEATERPASPRFAAQRAGQLREQLARRLKED
jgi:DNA helicase-2/ATP-dependent DNA helicase PcrA